MSSPHSSILHPRSYTGARRFERELTRLFERGWHLACLRRDAPNHDDYVLTHVGRRGVIVQNVAGELRAFSNVCPHRFSAIRNATRGNAALRCPYHSWSFDGEGSAVGIPHRHGLELAGEARPRLERWQLGIVGELVFVALRAEQTLANFLGPLASRLAELSSSFDTEVDDLSQEIRANWKLIMQNTLEFDHVFSVHEQTFARLVKRPVDLEEMAAANPNIAYRAVLRDDRHQRGIERKIDALFARAVPERIPGYAHALLFPSTTIGTTENHHVTVVTYHPVSAERTTMRARTFLLRIADLAPHETAMRDAVVPGELAFTRQLFEEDRRACEQVQRGVAQRPSNMRGVLLPNEHLVMRFQQNYLEAMRRGAARTLTPVLQVP
jgi:phenylpropionate dioxygenase-like ring-hydroxylating dioxygenase large terminal subunit